MKLLLGIVHTVFTLYQELKKLLVRVGNVENKCEDLNERVQTLENKDEISADSVKAQIQEEMLEMKEIEAGG